MPPFRRLRALAGLLLGLLMASAPARALDPTKPLADYRLRVWTTAQGLPNNSIYDIVQTRDGYLWVATAQGLARFDGVRFETFAPGNTAVLKTFVVYCLLEDAAGTLWIGTRGSGLMCFRDGSLHAVSKPGDLPREDVRSLVEGDDGTLWIATGGGFASYRQGRFRPVPPTIKISYSSYNSLAKLPTGEVLFGSRSGLFRLTERGLEPHLVGGRPWTEEAGDLAVAADGSLWTRTATGAARIRGSEILRLDRSRGLPGESLYGLSTDTRGTVWIGTTDGGLVRWHDGRIATVPPTSPLADSVTQTWEDREGSLWVGTYNSGLCQLSDTPVSIQSRETGLPFDNFRCLLKGRDGGLWLGTTTRGLLRLQDGQTQVWGRAEGLRNLWVQCLAEDAGGTVWAGTYGGGLYSIARGRLQEVISGREERKTFNVRCLLADHRGRIWAGLSGGGIQVLERGRVVRHLREAEGLEDLQVYALAEGAAGEVYAGTIGGKLYKIGESRAERLDLRLGNGGKSIFGILPNADGSLLLANGEGGLSLWRADRTTILGPDQGLPLESIFGISRDDQGRYWVRAQNSLYTLSVQDVQAISEGRASRLECAVFGGPEGVPSISGPASPVIFPSGDGRILTIGAGGLVSVEQRLRPPSPLVPGVQVEKILLGARPLTASGSEPWRQEEVAIEYTALAFMNPGLVRFRYQLEGYRDEWVDAGTRRTAYYTNLPPGRYTFRVKACNEDGVWNEAGAARSFELRPLWYQSRWFFALCGLAALGGVAGAFRWRTGQLRARQAELEATVETRTHDLTVRNRELEELEATVKAINQETELEPLLHSILVQVGRTFPSVQRGLFLLWDEGTDRYQGRAHMGLGEDAARAGHAFWLEGPELRGWLERKRRDLGQEVLLIRDIDQLPGFERIRFRPKALLVLPLEIGGHLEGLLTLQNMEDPDAFQDADLGRLLRFREHIVSALAKARNLRHLEEARGALEESEARYALAAEGANEAIWDVRLDTQQAYVSEKFWRILGIEGQDSAWSLQAWNEYVHPEDRSRVAEALRAHLVDRAPYDVEFRMQGPGGEVRWFRSRGQAMWGADGRALRMGGSIADITERRRAGEELLQAKAAAEAATEAKSLFLANMSHEIRTPMNAILGFAALGPRVESLGKAQDYFQKIGAAGQSLLGLVNDILDFSKVEAGKLELEAAPFPLGEVLGNVKNLFAQRAEEKGVSLAVKLDPLAPKWIVGDPLRLGQVLANLVGNAYKFTEAGRVEISVRKLNPGDDPVRLRFTVRDTGIGMTAEQQSRLFQAFSQADTTTTRKFGGTGLGLAISQRLVRLMGGEIEVTSIPGRGSAFSFEVIFPNASGWSWGGPERAEVEPPDALPLALRGARVLLVEDNAINQEVASEILKGFGIEVDIAANGLEAVRKVDHGAYDAVLMDIQMPEMDGYEATARIRERTAHARLPIIAMTAHALAGYRDECLEAGMNDYVAKPIDPVHLLAVLQTWIPAQPHEARRGPGTPDLPGAPAEPPPGLSEAASAFDVPEALGRLRGNQALYLDLLGDFARDFAGAATPIREALEQGAWDAAADLAHRIRGLAGNLSANALMRAAGDLEMAASAGDGAAARAALGPLETELARALTEARERAIERPVRPDQPASPAMPEGAPTSLLEALDRQLLLGEPDAVRTLEALTLLLAPGLRAEAESLRTLVASFAFPEARIRLQKLRAGLEGA